MDVFIQIIAETALISIPADLKAPEVVAISVLQEDAMLQLTSVLAAALSEVNIHPQLYTRAVSLRQPCLINKNVLYNSKGI